MEEKYLIQQQYFDLSSYLNSSNKVQNKIKEMYFYTEYINEEEFCFAAISDWQKHALCKKLSHNHWIGLGRIQFEDLERKIATILPSCLQQPDLTKCVRSHILGPFTKYIC